MLAELIMNGYPTRLPDDDGTLSGKSIGLCTELEMRDRAFQEDRTNIFQVMEELKRLCCTEAERARLRMDELSTQEEESKSAANQFMVQIQALRDKVNSLNNAREFL